MPSSSTKDALPQLINAGTIPLDKALHQMFQRIKTKSTDTLFADSENSFKVRYDASLNQIIVEKKNANDVIAIPYLTLAITDEDEESMVQLQKNSKLTEADVSRLRDIVARTINGAIPIYNPPVDSQEGRASASVNQKISPYNAQQEAQKKLIEQYQNIQKKIGALVSALPSGLQELQIGSRLEKVFIDNKFVQWQTTEEYQRYSRGLKIVLSGVPTFDNIPLPINPTEKIPDGLNLNEVNLRMLVLHSALEKKIHSASLGAAASTTVVAPKISASKMLNVDIEERFRRFIFKADALLQNKWVSFPCHDGLIGRLGPVNELGPNIRVTFPGGDHIRTWGYYGSGTLRHLEYNDGKYFTLETLPPRVQQFLESVMFEVEGIEMPEGFEIPKPRQSGEAGASATGNYFRPAAGVAEPAINKILINDLKAVTNFTTAHTFVQKYGDLLEGSLKELWPVIKECYGLNSQEARAQLDQYGQYFEGGAEAIRNHLTNLTKIIKCQEQLSTNAQAAKPPGSLGGEAIFNVNQAVSLQQLETEIKERLKTSDRNQDTEESRWLFALQEDEITSEAVKGLFLKHPANSDLIVSKQNATTDEFDTSLKWDKKSQTLVQGRLSSPNSKLKILLVGHGRDSNNFDSKLQEIKTYTSGKRVVVFTGFSALDYADIPTFETKIKDIFNREAGYAGGNSQLIVVAGATDAGIGRVYKLAQEAGIETLGIVSEEGKQQVSQYCKNIVFVNDPDKTWKVLAPNGESYMVSVAADGGVIYALGGGEITHSELTEAKKRQIINYAYSFDPDPQELAKRQDADTKRGKIVSSYTPVNDAITQNSWVAVEVRDDRIIFGNRSVDVLKNNFKKILANIPQGSVKNLDVTLAGCLLVDVNTPESGVPHLLANTLLAQAKELGVPPENLKLTASQLYVKVSAAGKKEFWLAYEGKWVTKEQALQEGVPYKTVWRYDSRTEKMVSEVQHDRFTMLVERLWQGTPFHEFPVGDKELILRVLRSEDINEMSKRSEKGKFLYGAIRTLPAEGVVDGHSALAHHLDGDAQSLESLARTVGVDSGNKEANSNAGDKILATILHQPGNKEPMPVVDHYTKMALGLRARLIYQLQTYIGPTSKGVLVIGAVAALCRIKVINERLTDGKLSPEEAAKLRVERNLALAEVGADLSDEAIGLVQNKLGLHITRSPRGATPTSQSSNFTLGTRMTSGIRSGTLVAGGVLLSAVGTAFAWYGVITAAQELQALSTQEKTTPNPALKTQLTAQITQLRVNLSVNIATAFIGTGLTAGGAISLVSSLAASCGLAGATSVAAITGAFMSIAGPIGGAMLVGAFVGLWIYNGVKTVEEFSKHIALDSFDKFLLGFGSMFGYVPSHLRISLEYQKFKEVVEKAARLEKSGLLESLPQVKHFYHFPIETISGKEIVRTKEGTAFFDGLEHPTTEVISRETIPPQTYYPSVDINFDTSYYLAISSNDSGKKHTWLTPADFIHTRKTSERISTDKAYPSGAVLTLHGRTVTLPNSASLETQNQNLDSRSVSTSLENAMPQALRDILTTQSDAQLFAAAEAEYLTLFCIHDNATKISFFKFSRHSSGYTVAAHLTQEAPAGLDLRHIILPTDRFAAQEAWPFFHDLDNDGLADLVIVSKNGHLQVARQNRDGSFALTTEFSLYSQQDGDKFDIPWYDSILGFGDTSRILYSSTSGGIRYGHAVLSAAEQKTQVSLVNLNRGQGVQEKDRHDKFVAPKDPKAGDFIFYLGGGRDKRASGGVDNDSFFVLDGQTSCFLEGHAGTDTLNLSRLSQETVLGVQIDVGNRIDSWSGQASITLRDGGSKVRVYFSDIENFTGTRGDDEITGDSKENIINGIDGNDKLDAKGGNDVLIGVSGKFNGGTGIDHYQLRRASSGHTAKVELIDDYSKDENSFISLDYRIDEIKSIAPTQQKHLLITLNDGGEYTLKDFYANAHAGPNKEASSWEVMTKDGFRFRLETAAQVPAALAPLRDIAVSFQGTLTEQDLKKAKIYLYANTDSTSARVEIFETIAGKKNVKHEIRLPSIFNLNLHFPFGSTHFLTGFNKADNFIAATGAQMFGGQGADSYFIPNGAQDTIEINNFDGAAVPEKDTLIVPWEIAATTLSIKSGDLFLKSSGQQAEVKLMSFMLDPQSRHLEVRSLLGHAANLEVSRNGTAYLATSLLSLNQENRLELYSASQGELTLDGSSRDLTADNATSTVIIDQSGQGNRLVGTESVRNYLQVFSGNNRLYGGCLADELHSGAGTDYLEGKGGDDAYYVAGSATIFDTAGEDSLVLLAEGKTQEELWLEKTTEGHLYILFRSDHSRQVVIKNYDQHKIEQIVINNSCLSYGDIDHLVQVMAGMDRFASLSDIQANPLVSEAMGRWSNLLTVSLA